MQLHVVMSGGGTAGHIYPALTVAEELRAGGRDQVTFVGTPEGLEARLVREAGVDFVGLPAKGFDRSRPLSLLVAVSVLLVSMFRAVGMLRRLRPDVVAGFGGYVSIPVGLAAVATRTPLVLHEQNSVPGMANKFLSRWAASVGVTYEGSIARLRRPERAVLTGNPVRTAVLAADRETGRAQMGLPADAPVLLAFGGSRGARHLNTALVAGRQRLLDVPGCVVLHVAGRMEAESVRTGLAASGEDGGARYRVFEYLDEMGAAMAASDLVIGRAGATSIAEITAIGRASVLVPYPFATDDHQTLNARALSDAGAAALIADADLDAPVFIDSVTALLEDADARATMAAASAALGRRDAGRRVAEMIRSLVGGTAEAVDAARSDDEELG